MAFTRLFPLYELSKPVSPAIVGIPTQFPYPPIPATTPESKNFVFGCVNSPNLIEFRSAIGRAPIVNTSRIIPPTPVAAPWYGSIKDG